MTDLKKKRQLDFLLETANHYNSNNRSSNEEGRCSYTPLTTNSEGCAIGRKLTKKQLNKIEDLCLTYSGVRELLHAHILDEGYFAGLDEDFLRDVQEIHDVSKYWNTEGLTDLGKQKVEPLKIEYNLNG